MSCLKIVKGTIPFLAFAMSSVHAVNYQAGNLGYEQDYTHGPKTFMGSFSDVYEYQLDVTVDTVNFATIVAGLSPSLYMQVYGPMASSPISITTTGAQSVTLDQPLLAGLYKVTVNGSVAPGSLGTYVFGVATAVPEADVSALMALGTVAVGGMVYHRRRKT